jgi:7-carboxy-7-deazaguanine synthase
MRVHEIGESSTHEYNPCFTSINQGEQEFLMQIAEIFTSIQGESSFSGLPCTFIRLAGCNLRCRYCDTSYALTGGESWSLDQIMDTVKTAGIFLAELTGGEPLLQEESYILSDLLLSAGYTVLIETNGSLPLDRVDSRIIKIMDLKCPSSGMTDHMIFSNIDHLTQQDEVKFVIGNRMDFDWARKIISVHGLLEKCKVLISPLVSKVAVQTVANWILEEKLAVRLQIQLHKVIWPGQSRGV